MNLFEFLSNVFAVAAAFAIIFISFEAVKAVIATRVMQKCIADHFLELEKKLNKPVNPEGVR